MKNRSRLVFHSAWPRDAPHRTRRLQVGGNGMRGWYRGSRSRVREGVDGLR
ncbi:hypothetical protein CMEL01_01987 [Colletotrichum melonis]|uniref:Uncharacterized protein n=1 Tax=Colletotrichum melonis TaxID=1209925 RepID=A0AAI9UL24_9PEZI|nr:hypothetical protein CMEL01_01987 [Colletotrichum melonis]